MQQFGPSPTLLERPRLMKKLQQAAMHRVTVISAPPGYGKTSAALQFAAWYQHPLVWHKVAARERDLPNLYGHSLRLLEIVCPGIKDLNPRGAADEIAATITNHLTNCLEDEIVYLLDDVHLLAHSQSANTWLNTFLKNLPDYCHVILISRQQPEARLFDGLARNELFKIDHRDLALNADELSHLAEFYHCDISQDEIEQLVTKLGGWTAGAVLHFNADSAEVAQNIRSEQSTPEALFAALADGLINSLRPDLREFLLDSSTLQVLTPERCQQILGLQASERYLDELQVRNLFVERTSEGLSYHTLLRDYLQSRLQVENPNQHVALHSRAARYFDSGAAPEEAFFHYLCAQEIQQAIAIAERSATLYYIQGRTETLLAWADQLDQLNAISPTLLSTCVNIDMGNSLTVARAEQGLAVLQRLHEQNADTENLANVHLQRATLHLQQGQYEVAASEAKWLDNPAVDVRTRGWALYVLGNAKLYLGEFTTACDHLEQALSFKRGDSDTFSLSQILQSLALAYAQLGAFDKASTCLQEVVGLCKELGGPRTLATALNNLGFHYYSIGEYEHALDTLKAGLKLLASFSVSLTEAYLLSSLAPLKRDLGLYKQAEEDYLRALEIVGSTEPTLQCSLLRGLSTLYRWMNQPKQALDMAVSAIKIAERHHLPREKILGCAVKATLLSADEANLILAEAHTSLQQSGDQVERLRVLGLAAVNALREADVLSLDKSLKTAESIARDIKTAHVFASEVVNNSRLGTVLSQYASQFTCLSHHIGCLIAARQQVEPDTTLFTHSRTSPPYHVRVMAFGKPRVMRDGHSVAISEWRAAAVRELFFYLLFKGPQTRKQVSLTFWPDGTTKQVRDNFHTMIYQIRAVLGTDAIVQDDGIYGVNPLLNLSCDANEFERLLHQARLLSPNDVQAEDLRRKAINLYAGPFLDDMDRDWTQAYRTHFEGLFLEGLLGLSECLQQRGDTASAMATLQQAFAVDPLHEETHCRLMQCYADSNQKHRVAQQLHDLEALLDEELGSLPSPETYALVETLLNA
jgi:ATP/maltotriose-dependent transcriptional regulator MalT/DNA-binding SARP family transcriptional activator